MGRDKMILEVIVGFTPKELAIIAQYYKVVEARKEECEAFVKLAVELALKTLGEHLKGRKTSN